MDYKGKPQRDSGGLEAVVESRCPLHGDNDVDDFVPTVPKHPDSLLFVCSRWHNIAIASRPLWSHIDIVLSCPQSEVFLARAKAYVARTERTPLDIHIVDPGSHPRYQISRIFGNSDNSSEESEGEGSADSEAEGEDEDEDGSTLYTVSSEAEASIYNSRLTTDTIDCLGPGSEPMPIRSLELAAHCTYHMSQLVALQYYLSRCAPGTLTRLLIRTDSPEEEPLGHFIEYGYVGDLLDVPTDDLERPLNTMRILHLGGLYPYWTSQAYHGLTDLCLGGRVSTPERRLVAILKANPELRALRLNCGITEPTARENQYGEYEGEPPFDVYLGSLEILDIHSLNYESTTLLLRRLSYSPKPLRLSLSKVDRDDNISHFLGHAVDSQNLNVTELRVTNGTIGDLNEYLEKYPNLQTLVIGEWDAVVRPTSSSLLFLPKSDLYWYEPGDKDPEVHLDTIYVARLAIPYIELQAMVDYYSVRRLVLWDSLITKRERGNSPTDAEIAALCQVVENLGWGEPNPIEQ